MPLLPETVSPDQWFLEFLDALDMVRSQPKEQVQIGATMPTKSAKSELPVGADEPTDDETDQGDEIEVAPLKRMGEVLRIIHGFDKFTPPTDDEIKERMIARKLNATSADELLAGSEAESLETFFGQPILVRGYDVVASDEQYDQAVFFVLDITCKGTPHTVTTGAMDVMETVAIAAGRGFLPMMCVADKSETRTKAGFYPVKLRRFDADTEPF